MKNKTIVDIMAMAQSYNNEIIKGMPPILASNVGSLEFPTDEEIYKYRKQRHEEYQKWLEQEIEECE